MNFGYLIIVSKNDKIDYHKMALLLALSIKRTQKEGYDNVAVASDDIEGLKFLSQSSAVDRTIFWEKKNHWDNRSYMNKITPWKYTICLDADMLFLRDHSHWVDYFINNADLYVCSNVVNYKNELIKNDTVHRKATVDNKMPNLYSAFTFFNSNSQFTYDFFTLVQYITEFPNEFKNLYYDKSKPEILGTDEIFSLAARILDIEEQISYPLTFPKFVHMKSRLQGYDTTAEDWLLELGINIRSIDNVKIGCYSQTDIIHYVDKSIANSNLMSLYENLLMKNFKL
jgi:hypothetical protein